MFGIKHTEKKVFTRNFLTEVSSKLTFPENEKCSYQRKKFIQTLNDLYPKFSDVAAQEIKLSPLNGQGKSVSVDTNDNKHQIILMTNDAKKKIILNNESLICSDSIETYSSSEAYDKNLIKVISNTSMFDIKEFKTFELRKLNLIGFTVKAKEDGKIVVPEALCQVVSKDLLANYVNIGGVTSYCQRNLYELKLVDEDYELNIKYGVIIDEKNKALTEGSGKVVVDLVVKKTSVTEKKDVESVLHEFHEILFDAFCWCVSDEFKKILG